MLHVGCCFGAKKAKYMQTDDSCNIAHFIQHVRTNNTELVTNYSKFNKSVPAEQINTLRLVLQQLAEQHRRSMLGPCCLIQKHHPIAICCRTSSQRSAQL